MDHKLKSCPFCGSNDVQLAAEHAADPVDLAVFARCYNCGGRTQGRVLWSLGDTKSLIAKIEQAGEDAAAAWNERPE